MFRVIIAGGRDFADYALLSEKMNDYLSAITDDIFIVCGQARGTDTLGEQYAKEHGYQVNYFPANWNRFGKSAGYIRNTEMAKNADALVAFWDGRSLGTKHMIATAEQRSWADQAKMRANRTAATYNNYILKNSFIWSGNIPDDILSELKPIE